MLATHQMDSELYALTIQALIHGQDIGDGHSKSDCRSYQMVEQLRQVGHFTSLNVVCLDRQF